MSRMMTVLGLVAVLAGGVLAAAGQSATDKSVVADVRAAVAARDFARGDSLLNEYRSVRGVTPELIEALSWLARGAFAAKELDKASQYAAETRTLAVAALESRRLDEDAHLQTALGAAIEVEALVRAARGERANAVYFLERDLERYANTPIHMRIQKNINLLSLEGQPAPSLEAREYIGRRVPSFDQLRGKAVLLFFWAHWCPDCKAQGPIIAKLVEKYRAQGLQLVAPTQRYGYIVAGQVATPEEELRHIVQVRDTYYGFLGDEPVPVSEANHKEYGVSSTPTLALVDRQGIVRLYHPGRMTEEELEAAIRKLL